jgi:hypothetical protein
MRKTSREARRCSQIFDAKIGQILTWLRLDDGRSRAVIARKAKIPVKYLIAMENGPVNIILERLDRLGWTLGIDPCAIMIWADIETRFTGLRKSNQPRLNKILKNLPAPPPLLRIPGQDT